MHRFPLTDPDEPPDDAAPAEAGSEVDPRLRATLDPAGARGEDVLLVSEEANAVLAAAIRELQEDSPPAVGGVAPVLGAGVVAEFLKHSRPGEATRSAAEGSRIDERR